MAGLHLPYCKNMTEVGHTKPKGFFVSSQLWKLKSMVPEPASNQGTWSSQHRQLWWPACPAVEVRAEKSHEVPAKSKMELLCFVMILSQDAQSRSMSTRARSLGTSTHPLKHHLQQGCTGQRQRHSYSNQQHTHLC